MKPSEILDTAANIIIRDGWNQGVYYKTVSYSPNDDAYPDLDDEANRTAPCCQAGAISRAIFGKAWTSFSTHPDPSSAWTVKASADNYANRYIRLRHKGVKGAIEFNDLPTTTADDVVAALRGAAQLAREGGE